MLMFTKARMQLDSSERKPVIKATLAKYVKVI